ncbi:MAG: cupredoxin domain-containing protein [Acidimicrobiia bacterium]
MRRARRHRGPAAVPALLLLAAACGGHGGHKSGRTVTIEMRDIAFDPDRLEVKAGETVEFVFRNTGMAEHGAVIGDEKLQESQEGEGSSGHAGGHQGSEHAARVVLSPGREGTLTYTFDEPGALFIGCHVPHHWDAGMKVAVTVS